MLEMIKIEIKIGDEFRVQDVCYRCERTDGKDVKFKIV